MAHVDCDERGSRHKPWRKVCQESKEFQFNDWRHEGRTTVHDLLKHVD